MNREEMTKNFVFREFECGLSIEEAAKLCFKTVSEVKRWDKGEKIPPICKRLMRWHSRKELYHGDEWWGFRMEGYTPTKSGLPDYFSEDSLRYLAQLTWLPSQHLSRSYRYRA